MQFIKFDLYNAGMDFCRQNLKITITSDSVILFTHVQPVLRSEKCLQMCETDIRSHLILDLIQVKKIQSLEIVDRASETQVQVTENVNWISQSSRG